MITGNTTGARNDLRYNDSSVCKPGNLGTGPDLVYRLSLPPLTRLESTLRSSLPDGGSNWDSIFNLTLGSGVGCGFAFADGGFGGQACIAGADDPDDPTDVQSWVNTTSTTQDVFLIVDAFTSTVLASGPFTLTTVSTALPPGDTCANVQPLTLPVTQGGLSLAAPYGGDVRGGPGCQIGTSSSDRIFSIVVPAQERLVVRVDATGFIPTVNLTRTCETTISCVAGGIPDTLGGPAIAIIDNNAATPSTFFAVVDTGTLNPTGSFTLTAYSMPYPLPAGNTCTDTAPPATFSTVLQNETFTGYLNEYFSAGQVACAYLPGLDRAYGVTIPAGQVLRATATPSDGGVPTMDLAVSIVPVANDCQSGPCVAGANASSLPGASEVAVRRNPGATSENVYVVVDSNLTTAAGTYSLALNLAPPLVGDICSNTEPAITASTSFGAETLTNYADDYRGTVSGCAFAAQPDRTYRVIVPAGYQLTATTTSTADHALSLVGGTAASCEPVTSCLASADLTSGGTETLRWPNASSLARQVFLIVDRFNASGSPDYSLSVDLSPIPYLESTTATACSTLVAPTTLIASVGDDSTSAVIPLPFPFTFFGTLVTHYGVTTNGNVQFLTSSMGSIVNQWANATIPYALEPNGFAAPFWDDLHVPLSGGAPAIRSAVTGSAPNQVLTIEWFDLSLASGGGGGTGTRNERLNFQVKLFQTTGVIEFHYCSLLANGGSFTGVSGSGATVGLENFTGTNGTIHSFNTSAAVSPSTALRFTPYP